MRNRNPIKNKTCGWLLKPVTRRRKQLNNPSHLFRCYCFAWFVSLGPTDAGHVTNERANEKREWRRRGTTTRTEKAEYLRLAFDLSMSMRWSCLCHAMGPGTPRMGSLRAPSLDTHYTLQPPSMPLPSLGKQSGVHGALTSRSQGQRWCWCWCLDRHCHTSAPRQTETERQQINEVNPVPSKNELSQATSTAKLHTHTPVWQNEFNRTQLKHVWGQTLVPNHNKCAPDSPLMLLSATESNKTPRYSQTWRLATLTHKTNLHMYKYCRGSGSSGGEVCFAESVVHVLPIYPRDSVGAHLILRYMEKWTRRRLFRIGEKLHEQKTHCCRQHTIAHPI